MIPIHQLLSRIRWDPEFGRGTFDLGYFDRVEERVVIVPGTQHAASYAPRVSKTVIAYLNRQLGVAPVRHFGDENVPAPCR